jgi:O-antigen ligase
MASPTTRRAPLARPARTSGSEAARRFALPLVGAAGRPDPLVLVGAAALGAAIVLAIALPPNLLSVLLGVVAVVGLAREPRLGVLPAALLVVLAVPYGRAAENGLASVAGIPLRFHDGAVGAAFLLSLPALRRLTFRPLLSRIVLAWVVIGIVGIGVAFVADQALRDILRDARWWFLYAVAALALWAGVRRAQVIRGLLIGATIFAIVIFGTAVLPAFDGALKDRALAYDWGLLRLQFSNSVFVVAAIGWVGRAFLLRPGPRTAAWLLLLAGAIVLSLTRMSILGMLGVVGLTVLGVAVIERARVGLAAVAARTVMVGAILVVSTGIAFGTFAIGDRAPAQETPGVPSTGIKDPLGRIFFQDPNSDAEAIGRGRLVTYRAAVDVIRRSPIVGHGLGTLVPIEFTFGGSRPATPGMQPGVDNALLTVAMKSGAIGVLVFIALVGYPLLEVLRRRHERAIRWYAVAWLGILGLMMTQSFATTGYGPFGVALLIALPALRRARSDPDPAGPEPVLAGR